MRAIYLRDENRYYFLFENYLYIKVYNIYIYIRVFLKYIWWKKKYNISGLTFYMSAYMYKNEL